LKAQSLKARIDNLSKEKNINKNTLIRFYMFERFIERLSISKYKEKFIIKGGCYLANIFGLDTRATKDIDYCLNGISLELLTIDSIIKDIIETNINDNTIFTLEKIEPIRDEDEYDGYRVFLKATIENIQERFHIDIVAGNAIAQNAITFKYQKLFDSNDIKILAYSLETVLAEKVETVLTRGSLSSRMKDYLDIHIIENLYYEKLSKRNIKKAFEYTFINRNTENLLADYDSVLNRIKGDKTMSLYWSNYKNKNNVPDDLAIDSITEEIRQIMNDIKNQ